MHPGLVTAMEGNAPGVLHPGRALLASPETWLETCELLFFPTSPGLTLSQPSLLSLLVEFDNIRCMIVLLPEANPQTYLFLAVQHGRPL